MLAYLDANILIAYILGPTKERRNYPFAQRVFTDIGNGVYSALISNLVLVEILNALRRIKGREYRHLSSLPSDNDCLQYIKTESDSIFQNLVTTLMQVGKQIQFTDCDKINARTVFDMGLNILNRTTGKIAFRYNVCGNCRTRNNYSNFSGLGPIDISHIFLAKELGCDQLITLDQGFEEVQNNPDVTPLNIVVLK
ncbi:type II toxin-antitoxin system VapC family toxin [Candidatus Bathyarchaeota archaeon]|nr:type II toxin-antitoxin system VapC family toxin [Candidatus Bathyarchaeota archaeon]